MSRRIRWTTGAALALALALAVPVLWHVRARPASPSAPVAVEVTRPQPAPRRPRAPAPRLPPPALPASLAGTEMDGDVEVDREGNLVVTLELRRLFDYFLGALGEEDEATIRARIAAAASARLSARAAAQLAGVLDRYLALRRALRALAGRGDVPEDLGDRLALLHRVRREHMPGAEGDAFFAEDEQLVDLALQRRRAAEPGVSGAEQQRLADDVEARTPPALRAARAEAQRPLRAFQREQELRAAGASAAQIESSRADMLGAEAAGRLSVLDRQRDEWAARLASYRARRTELERSFSDPAQRARAISALVERSFTPPERVRVEALDRRDGIAP